jgi:hypothetical protein
LGAGNERIGVLIEKEAHCASGGAEAAQKLGFRCKDFQWHFSFGKEFEPETANPFFLFNEDRQALGMRFFVVHSLSSSLARPMSKPGARRSERANARIYGKA